MSNWDNKSIVIIGSGAVAYYFTNLFIEKGISISGIHSRNETSGNHIAKQYNIPFFNSISASSGAVYFVAVKDDAVIAIINELPKTAAVIYTSGTIDLSHINHPNCSVFYPLQSFDGDLSIKADEIPILLESKNTESNIDLQQLCKTVGLPYFQVNSEKRKEIHLCAVFLNNFIIHMGNIAFDEMKSRNIESEILKPLLEKTMRQLLTGDSLQKQTGPAKRNDKSTIIEHKKMLSGENLEVYNAMTNSILKKFGYEL